MRRRLIAALAAFVAVGIAACDTPTQPTDSDQEVSANVVDGAMSWADMAGVEAPLAAADVNPAVRTVFAEEGLQAVVGGPGVNVRTGLEDFEGMNGIGVIACTGPFDVLTNDACYSPDEILEGYAIDNLDAANDPAGMVAISPEGLGLPSSVAGPNFFVDGTEMTFGYGGMQEVWFDVYAPFHGPCYKHLYVYGPGGLAAHFIIWTGSGLTPASYGVIWSSGAITRLEFVQSDPCGELFDNVLLVKY